MSVRKQKNFDPTSSDRPLITVAVLNWNRKDDLLLALGSIRNQTYSPIEMLVVDNASTDGSAEAVEREFSEARVVRLDRNYGCPGGRNRSIPHARGDFIFYCDNDGLLHRESVERAYQAMCRYDRVSVVTGLVKSFSTLEEVDTRCDVGPTDTCYFAPTFLGGVSLHRKTMYDEVGTYPDDYMYGGEETDMAYRMLDRGHLILYDPTVILWHREADTARIRHIVYLRKQSNPFVTVWAFWPIELAIIYTLRALIIDPISALRAGYFWAWLCDRPRLWTHVARSVFRLRHPIRRKTMQTIWKLRRKDTVCEKEVFKIDTLYWKDVLKLLLEAK
ncbi:MAG: glycosyltransferase [Phycisphaerae bacterium]|nr:glycosyltransferase [Phycisphaerae bacterium]